MALQSAKPGGTYFEFDPLCNEGAVVVFKVRAFESPRQMTNGEVNPVLVDLVVLTGAQAKRVVRGESIIGAGITGPLRRSAVGDDIVCRMAWGQRKGSSITYAQANPATDEDMAVAVRAFQATNGDPYTAAERATNPTATLAPAQAAPAPAQAPPADAPGPWQTAAAPQGQPVGGPQGPDWGQAAAAEPVGAAASAW